MRWLIFSLTPFIILLLFMHHSSIGAEKYKAAPLQIQAALFVKLLSFHKGISRGGDIYIHVIDNTALAAELQQVIGEKIGNATLTAINTGSQLPSGDRKPSAVYVSEDADLAKILDYTSANKVLSITGAPDLVAKGVTLGVGILNQKPHIFLNISSSKKEGVDWNPAILKVSTIID